MAQTQYLAWELHMPQVGALKKKKKKTLKIQQEGVSWWLSRLRVKDPELSLLWLMMLLWHGFDS